MTPDAVAADLALLLAAARPLYDELGRLQAEHAALRTVDDARLAYEAMLEGDTKRIAALRRERDALAVEQRRRRIAVRHTTPAAPPSRSPAATTTTARQAEPAVTERPRRPQSSDRRNLKKLVSRWQFAWSLDPAVIARVNGIADDAERPLGEALALLEWRVYEMPIPGESADDHAARLGEWSRELGAYADHLRAAIETDETRYRNVLDIWRIWSRAKASDEGRGEWDDFIEKSRAQKRSEIAALTAEIAALRKAIDS